MKPKNRDLRVRALAQGIAHAERASRNLLLTQADLQKMSDDLIDLINRVLDSEYEQGFEDASNIAVATIEKAKRGGLL